MNKKDLSDGLSIHPYLSLSWEDLRSEWNSLILSTYHTQNLLLISELQLGNAFKAFLEVRLHTQGIFRLGQDLKQLVVGQEKESGEKITDFEKLI